MGDNLQIFNDQITNFLSDILQIFPDESKIRLCQEQFKMIRKIRKNIVFNNFIKYVYPYKQYILQNEKEIISQGSDFFLKNKDDESKLLNKLNSAESITNTTVDKKEVFQEIFNLDNLWKNKMTEQHKKKVLVYFKVLIRLSDRILKEYVKKL